MHILMAQINTQVGDFGGNTSQVIEIANQAALTQESAVVVFPELTLSGYPPEDLLLRPALCKRVNDSIERLCRELPPNAWVIVGYPIRRGDVLYNCAGVIHEGELQAEYHKNELPNYQVFDEKRYFTAGSQPCVFDIQGTKVGLSICEDIWVPGPSAAAASAGAELLINLNASPFHKGKQRERIDLVAKRCRDNQVSVVYVNQVGGQDELVFDGGSFAMSSDGSLAVQSLRFESTVDWCEFPGSGAGFVQSVLAEPLDELASVWQALVLGMRDYVNKNGFPSVVLGLSGGVDSALTLAVAVDALGPERVEAVMMPFRYTSDISIADAAEQSATLGVRHSVISIEPIYESFLAALSDEFAGQLAPLQRAVGLPGGGEVMHKTVATFAAASVSGTRTSRSSRVTGDLRRSRAVFPPDSVTTCRHSPVCDTPLSVPTW